MRTLLQVGDKAPAIRTKDMSGKVFDLTKSASPHTLVTFLRYSGCPYCNLALHRLSLESNILKRNGCEIIAFVNSTDENIQKNIYDRQQFPITFPLIADIDQKWYKKFGVSPSLKTIPYCLTHIPEWLYSANNLGYKQANIDGNFFMVPAFFLIDKKGTIVYADYQAGLNYDSTFTPIYETLTFGPSL